METPHDESHEESLPAARPALDLDEIRARLAKQEGRVLWQSLEELAGDPAFDEGLRREFPRLASEWPEGTSRRRFLELAGASFALGGLVACTRQPTEKIVPYVRQPEELVPGKPVYYASSVTLAGVAEPVLVESHLGRPTKLEGNPEHPASMGGTTARAQAAVLGLYDPDRSQAVSNVGRVRAWPAAAAELSAAVSALPQGEGFRILTGCVTSPTVAAQLRAVFAKYPKAQWHSWEAAGEDAARLATKWAYGTPMDLVHDLSRADGVATVDHDLLGSGPGSVRAAHDFSKRRRQGSDPGRLYAVESTPTPTGSIADHRFVADAADVERMLLGLARKLGVSTVADLPEHHAQAAGAAKFLDALAKDLVARGNGALVTAGPSLSPAAHVLAIAINARLGSVGRTVRAVPALDRSTAFPGVAFGGAESIAALCRDMAAGGVKAILILGGNPVFDAPADLRFADALAKVPVRFRLGLHEDETAELCHWNLPMAHELESFGDALAADGTPTFRQPLIEPLYGGRTEAEVLAMLLGNSSPKGEELVRASSGLEGFAWRKALHDGFTGAPVEGPVLAMVGGDVLSSAAALIPEGTAERSFEISFRPDETVHDGRFANNGWLQELPRPSTKLTWDNAALVSPSAAKELGISRNGDLLEISAAGAKVEIPAVIVPGQGPRTITLHFGQGRRRGGRVAAGTGTDVFPLRTSAALWRLTGAKVSATGKNVPLAITQGHFRMEGRDLAREVSATELAKDPEKIRKEYAERPSHDVALFPEWKYEGYKWGMAIDLSVCIGCSACVVACQSENNIAVVGKEQVLRGREMQWIRIDRYNEGDPDSPRLHNQPVPCMQCENAPCEVVCPVAATSHSDEGLNDMTYNRCVGTRYCSNNCPYKVRRFNFLQYQDKSTPVLDLLRNPDVTVRERGVMEKCTYCVQRINVARIGAERDGRRIADGEVVPACAQACSSHAISFGDLNDPKAAVVAAKGDARNYGLLEELATRPRTTYLARVRNPNPELEA